tara:strand:+ start:7670 stop:9103 length:1434 start_codon:yes stop_codon:yes gene_type:complete
MPVSIGKSGSSKISSKNNFSTRDQGTVDSNHNEKMAEFKNRKKNLSELKDELKKKEERYEKLKKQSYESASVTSLNIRSNNSRSNNSRSNNSRSNSTNSSVDLQDPEGISFVQMKELSDLERDIDKTKKDIDAISTNKEEMNYLLKTGTLLFQYYDYMNHDLGSKKRKSNWISNIDTNKFTIGNNPVSSRSTSRSLSRKRSVDKPANKRPKRFRPLVRKVQNSQSVINATGTQMSRGEMLDEFKALTDPNWVKKTESKCKKEESICEDCEIPKILQYKESKYICPNCGIEELTFIDSDRPSFKDPPPDANYFAYRRINHFNELLAQFQAKESTHIPKDVFDAIRKELKKQRKSVKDLDYELVKDYLKKYSNKNYTQYYDHIFHIINRLNGDKPLNMTPEMENNLRYLFLQIQEPFDKYCPPDRKNFISYNFVFYKFCKLFGYNEFLHYFPLLKSKDKLYDQEKIWQKIMTDIGLPYK